MRNRRTKGDRAEGRCEMVDELLLTIGHLVPLGPAPAIRRIQAKAEEIEGSIMGTLNETDIFYSKIILGNTRPLQTQIQQVDEQNIHLGGQEPCA